MSRIKGWAKTKYIGNMTGYTTTERPLLSIWLEKDVEGYWYILADFNYINKKFKTKQQAKDYMIKWMKAHPKG